MEYDYIIKGGAVYAGGGNPVQYVDIAVLGDQISYIGPNEAKDIPAREVIDATGLVVAPGFIDPHTHSLGDLQSSGKNLNLNYLKQGVTTVFAGNDGAGSPNVAEVMRGLEQGGVGTNIALYIGHGAVRRAVMGDESRAPTPAELDTMKALVKSGMQEGALGLSSGLYYAPGSFADTDEIVELASVVAGYCGVYDSHIRDESSYTVGLLAAVTEAIEIGRRAGVPTHISHIKALGVDVHGMSNEVVALVDEARVAGLKVTADQYPWLASGTSIAASLVPRWVMAGGGDVMKSRLVDADLRLKIRAEMAENLRRRGGAGSLLLVGENTEWRGKTLAQMAARWGDDAIDAAIRIIMAGDTSVASFNMNKDDVAYFMQQPWVMTGSDGSSGHPRKYGTYPQKYQQYVVKDRVLSLAEFVHKSSGLVADTFGMARRGYLREGYVADIVVFDPHAYRSNASYTEPDRLSSGVQYLFVGGQPAIWAGQETAVIAGRIIRNEANCAVGRSGR
ncbi:N-acyl-D-amino-acid deacylase family protein [Kordiimonas sp.]|uniref:N-acyl-D-amino-acid deacylase family protein n=1 Tax=Kordiimonas sp. TaxID=1970157 RepID=UPI003A953C37